jgi:hypothetical protein
MVRVISAGVFGFLLGAAAMYVAPRFYPQTMEECLLDQLRGIPGNIVDVDALRSMAVIVCLKRVNVRSIDPPKAN